jgi:hypothetical protein
MARIGLICIKPEYRSKKINHLIHIKSPDAQGKKMRMWTTAINRIGTRC